MREFRARHAELLAAGARVAGVTLDSLESCRRWAARLHLPYPLLSDVSRLAGEQCQVLRRVGLGGWNIELFQRATFLIDTSGFVRAVWGHVNLRGHGREVVTAVQQLSRPA